MLSLIATLKNASKNIYKTFTNGGRTLKLRNRKINNRKHIKAKVKMKTTKQSKHWNTRLILYGTSKKLALRLN